MPVTARTVFCALTSAVLAAALATGSSLAAGATPSPDGDSQPTQLGAIPPADAMSIAVVLPLVAPPTTTGILDAEALALLTGPNGRLTRQLDSIAGTPVAIALDPMLPASIRALGSSAPDDARQWLARLAALSNEVFLLSYADADVVSAARTDTLGDLAPAGFDFLLNEADFSTTAAEPGAEPTPGVVTSDAPPYPTTDALLAWPSSLPKIGWPVDDLGADDLPALADAGYTHLLVDSDAVGDPDSALVSLGDVQGVVIDSSLSAGLASAAETGSITVQAAALDALEAQLVAEATAHPARSVVLALDRSLATPPPGLAATLARLEATTTGDFVPLADILAMKPVKAHLGGGRASDAHTAVFTELAEAAAAEADFSRVLDDPALLLDERRLERIALYSVGWLDDPNGWSSAVDEFRHRSTEILSSVRLEQGSDVALLAAHANMTISVSNALPYPVTVRVRVNPQTPILRVLESPVITVEPESTATAIVPVEAAANGTVTVRTVLESPDGLRIDAGHGSVAVHAEWEGIGTFVVTLALALVFVAGLVRLILRRRRSWQTDSAPDDAPSESND